MKIFWTLILLAGLGAGGYYFWSKKAAADNELRANSRPTTAPVEARDILFAVSAAGDIGPADQVSVRPEINGRIAILPVDIGDKVKKDSLLCQLDDRDLQIERQQRVTEVDGARLQLVKAERTYRRNRELYEERLIAQEAFDDSRTEYDLATNSLSRSEAALRLVEDRLSKTKILAPFDCTVLTRPVSIGQAVSGSGGFNSGTEVMTIANLNNMIVNAHINQADVIRLSAGQAVEIQVESVPGLFMRGIVDRIAPQAIIRNGIKGFSARIAIQDIDPRVRPGMTAALSIPIASAENVLSVPLGAVFTEGTERYVFVQKGLTFERRPVIIGISDFNFAEVQSGLSSGEVISLEQVVDSDNQKTFQPTNRARLASLINTSAPAVAAGSTPKNGQTTSPTVVRPERRTGSGS